jgi:hypothetical protein
MRDVSVNIERYKEKKYCQFELFYLRRDKSALRSIDVVWSSLVFVLVHAFIYETKTYPKYSILKKNIFIPPPSYRIQLLDAKEIWRVWSGSGRYVVRVERGWNRLRITFSDDIQIVAFTTIMLE